MALGNLNLPDAQWTLRVERLPSPLLGYNVARTPSLATPNGPTVSQSRSQRASSVDFGAGLDGD